MAKYRKVDPRIWNDEKFRRFSQTGKLVFLFLMTHPHMTALGAMRATTAGLAAELEMSPKAFGEAFHEAFLKGMVEYDQQACFIALPRFLRYNGPESPNVVKAWSSSLELLPECPLKGKLIQRVKDFAEALPEAFHEALPEAFAKSMPYQEQEQEQDLKTLSGDSAGVSVGAFERFWTAYPKKREKLEAQKVWRQLHPKNGLAEKIIAAVESAKTSQDWKRDNGKWIPNPAKYLRRGNWEDDLLTPATERKVVY